MTSPRDQPGRAAAEFVRRAHRRRLACRVFEDIGVCVLVGCGVAAVATILVAVRGAGAIEPLSITLIILAVAAACGAFVGIRRSPSMLSTAMEVDRQLKCPDLLSSALLTPRSTDPYSDARFASIVLQLADARIANVAPADLLLRRFTPRAWSGIGLATVSVVTLALLVTTSPPVTIAGDVPADRVQMPRSTGQLSHAPRAKAPSSAENRRELRSGDANRRPDAPDEDQESTASTAQTNSPRGIDRGDGSGESGSSQTNDLREKRSDHAPSDTSARPNPGDRDGSAEAGIGHAAREVTPGAPRAGTVLRDRGTASPAPPWSTSTWSADRAAAREAVGAGSISAPYRDLVRDYFDIE